MSRPANRVVDKERNLPLLVRAPGSLASSSPGDAVQWAGEHREWLEERLLIHGALLLRGLPLANAADFEGLSTVFADELADYTRGNSPRRLVSGNIYTATDVASAMLLPLHNELSYSSNHPARVMLFCETPADSGGQTPVANVRRVLDGLSPDVRARFAENGVRYIQNLPQKSRHWNMPCWSRLFATDEPSEVDRICDGLGIDTDWRADGVVRLTNTRAAEAVHPRTGESIWFNQAHIFHRTWSSELRRVGRYGLAAAFLFVEKWAGLFRDLDRCPHHAVYGDGTEIGADIEDVRRTLWREAAYFEWQRGDVLVLDNQLAAHGRMPFRGERRVLAALGN